MKGTHFKQPYEYKIDITGESWSQGSVISGNLNIVNHSGTSIDLVKPGVQLSYCTKKKLKDKDPKGITELSSLTLANDQSSLDFTFELKPDCPITEKAKSLYIIYGDLDSPFDSGFLELNITPSQTINDFIQTFEQFFRFKLKTLKMKKDVIEAVVTPPASKDWTSIQKMSLQFKMDGDDLNINYIFAIKKMSFDASAEKVKDEKKEISVVIKKNQYERYGAFDQMIVKDLIDDVLNEVKLKPLL